MDTELLEKSLDAVLGKFMVNGKRVVTEQLKKENQLKWVQRMGNIQQRTEEIVINELIYA